MDPGMTLDLFGRALWLVVIIVAVIVGPALAVGLIISVFQAATQINEQTLSFLPRLIVTLLAVMWAGPWIVTNISDLFNYLFMNIPRLIS
ncbi:MULTISPECIES: flagellar biosynthesis protein FliQ [Marinobacterium]|jgi:flagellar biosynthetic protein FliQ|uniref:Flagellar biosynthetic protein FliQ n=2 Tax=Gammaproteobacteria TaxID=1236 RepID=A0A1H3YED1_9GAMM|nr:flagellar biosynthesis protein FliQ [Marinobacterium iners]QSR33920.1 flagellar biosynthetic protein FliQ [Marinobacterium iners]SEA09925.1 flagellar biosynthetic protein FliQ [Marinobacterium iners DSM 11526]